MSARKAAVLVVDDDPDLRELLTMVLASESVEVVGGANDAEALESMNRQRPDLILLDMRMPVMDGGAALDGSS